MVSKNFSIIFLTLTLICFQVNNAYTMIEKGLPNTAPGKCISNTYKLEMNSGDSVNVPGMCMEASCGSNGDISYVGCSVAGIPPNCHFIEPDMSLPYPKCCKKDFKCDE